MAVRVPKLTVEQYLAIEQEAEWKSEMSAMAGGTGIHADLWLAA